MSEDGTFEGAIIERTQSQRTRRKVRAAEPNGANLGGSSVQTDSFCQGLAGNITGEKSKSRHVQTKTELETRIKGAQSSMGNASRWERHGRFVDQDPWHVHVE